MEVGGQRHAPAALPPGETRYPLYRKLDGPKGQSGWVRKILPSLGFNPRTVQPTISRYTDYAIPVLYISDTVPLVGTINWVHWTMKCMQWTPLKHINHVYKWFKIKSLESKQLSSPVRNNSAPGDMSAANMPIQATLSFGNIWAVGTLQLGSLATFQS